MLQRKFVRSVSFPLLILAALAVFQAAPAKAETQLQSIGLGVSVPTPLGTNYQTYSRLAGGFAEAIVLSDFSFLKYVAIRGSVGYQPYSFKGLENVSLRQFNVSLGVETLTDGINLPAKPFAGLELGTVYSWMNYADPNTTTNSALSMGGTLRFGFEIPVWGDFTAILAAPISMQFSSNTFVALSGDFSLRWAL